jgi:predicted dehydrogenase
LRAALRPLSEGMNKLRWGILGAADIARKNWKAIRNSGNGIVTAVASRDLQRCQKFIQECEASAPMGSGVKAFATYEDLIASKDIDAVYIPLPTGARKEWVLRAAEARKHIVCEKPCAVSREDFRTMLNACERNSVQFMDGVMFMHSKRLEKICAEIDAARIGEVKRITSAFSFHGDSDFFENNIRVNSAMEPFGCLGDLGWYCIRFALWAMREELPKRVTGRILAEARGKSSPAAVPSSFSAELFFADGVSSSFYCSFDAATEQWAIITGSDGLIRLDDFVLPFFGNQVGFDVFNANFNIVGCDFNMEPHRRRVTIPEYSNSHATSQETNLFRAFAAQVQSGKLNTEWPAIAFKTQAVMEACFDSARNGSALVELGS